MANVLRTVPYKESDDPNFVYQSFVMEDVDMPIFPSLTEAVNSLVDVPEWDVVNVHHILQASAQIARESRRGLANTLITNDLHQAFHKLGENYMMYADNEVNGTYIMYQGTVSPVPGIGMIDGAIMEKEDGFHVHPDYKKYVRKLNLI